MPSRNVLAALFLAAVATLSSCSPGPAPEETPTPAPVETLTDPPEKLQEQFEELSGLVLPSDAENLEIEGKLLEGERPRYELRFETTRGGAEVICTTENLGVYRSSGGPSDEQHKLFPVREQDAEIDLTVKCAGSHPENGRVQREVMVLFPKDGLKNEDGEPDGTDTAIVYAYTVLWPRD